MGELSVRYPKSVHSCQFKLRSYLSGLRERKEVLKMVFTREYKCMQSFHREKAKKSKKGQIMVKTYENEIDEEVRDLLIDEYFHNVCVKYVRLLIFIYCSVQQVVKPL